MTIKLGHDRLSHLQDCPILRPLFAIFEDPPSPQLIYLGLRRDLTPLTGSDAITYTLIWKFALAKYTRVDTEGETFDHVAVFKAAVKRTATRMEAHGAELKRQIERYRSRGEEAPSRLFARYSKDLAPVGSFDQRGNLTLETGALKVMQQAKCYTHHPPRTYTSLPDLEEATTNYTYTTSNPTQSTRWSQVLLEGRLEAERAAHDVYFKANVEEARRALRRRRAGHKQ